MALFLFNTSKVISPALVLSSLLLLIPFLPWLYLPRNASPTHPIPSSSSPTAPAADPYSPDASLPSPETHMEDVVLLRRLCSAPDPLMKEGRCAGRVSSPPSPGSPSSPPVIPEQQQGVDSSNSSKGEHGLGLLARTRALLPEVEIAVPLMGPILAAMPLEDLTSIPLELLQALVVATVAAELWRRLCGSGMAIRWDSTQARRALLQLKRDARRLEVEGGSVLPIFSTHLKVILFGLVVEALNSLISGSLVWIMVFWACMPTTRSRMQLSFQILVVLDLLLRMGIFCIMAIETLAIDIIWLKITLFLKRRHHQPARCHRPHEYCPGTAEELGEASAFTSPA